MRGRIIRTNGKTSTHVLTVLINPLEADAILNEMDTGDDSRTPAKLMFRYLMAISDQDKKAIECINADDVNTGLVFDKPAEDYEPYDPNDPASQG